MMVQLKPLSKYSITGSCHKFQFHDGTIKTLLISFQSYGTVHFNSNMVQLKRITFLNHWSANIFQFHDGTIKTPSLSLILDFSTYFNSNMVQLKLNCPF